jgi:two-component system LytT family response regulator
MEKIRAVIIDDEPKLREVLNIKLKKSCPAVEVVGFGQNINEGFDLISREKPDLVFLDITMPGGTGFDLLEKIPTIDFQIVFVTGYSEYSIKALKMSATDYLLKPVSTSELIIAVNKVAEKLKSTNSYSANYDVLKKNISDAPFEDKRIVIPNDKSYEFVLLKDIIRIEGWQKYTKVHTIEGDVFVSSYNIGVYKDMLDADVFYQTHKSHIINERYIKKYLKEGLIYMIDGSEVPVARRKKEEFMNRFIKS